MTEQKRPIVPLAEWGTAIAPGARLGPRDTALAAQLLRERKLEVEELRDGVRVSARSWVGVVAFDGLEVRIEPKLAGDRLDLLAMIDFARGLDALQRTAGRVRFAVPDEHLLDLLARLLAHECARLVRRGLITDYTERDDDLSAVRGRIKSDELVLRRLGRADRVPCRFDERLQDVLENQLLALALRACHRRVAHAGVRQQIGGLLQMFDEVCDPVSLDLSLGIPTVEYHRLNDHYRTAHDIALLILEGSALRSIDDAGRVGSHAFLLDMNDLFQRFVWRACDALARGTTARVRYQASSSSIIREDPDDRPYGRVIPDLLVEHRGPDPDPIAIDAKYKDYDAGKVSPGDTYQAFLYAYAFSKRSNPTALLVHPSSAGRLSKTQLRIRGMNALPSGEIGIVSIPVRETVRALRSGAAAESVALRHGLRDVLIYGSPAPRAR